MWIIYNFLDNFYDYDQSTKTKKYIYNIFLPIFFALEYYCFVQIWKKIIIRELFTNDEIVDFFDKNEFGYKKNKIYKKALVSENEFIDRFDLEEVEVLVKKEYIETLTEKLKLISFNVEDYISLIVNSDFITVRKNGETFRDRIYVVTIQYVRYFYIEKMFWKLFLWLGISTIVSFLTYVIFKLLFHFINLEIIGNILNI